jgi:predicted acetyltransferase
MSAEYEFLSADLRAVYPEIEHLCKEHYAEMTARLEGQGLYMSDYNPRLDAYFQAVAEGRLSTYLVRLAGVPVGHALIYVYEDMHNRDLVAYEDVLFITKTHRNGVGKKFVRAILDDLKARGVKRLDVNAVTDLRVAKLWARMGFKSIATSMRYNF